METKQANEKPEMSWIDAEIADLNEKGIATEEQKPSLKMVENKIYEIEIDYTKPWPKWQDPVSKTVKKIIPCKFEGKDYSYWLNCANPIYSDLLKKGKTGQRKFKIIRIGQAKATRYKLVD